MIVRRWFSRFRHLSLSAVALDKTGFPSPSHVSLQARTHDRCFTSYFVTITVAVVQIVPALARRLLESFDEGITTRCGFKGFPVDIRAQLRWGAGVTTGTATAGAGAALRRRRGNGGDARGCCSHSGERGPFLMESHSPRRLPSFRSFEKLV